MSLVLPLMGGVSGRTWIPSTAEPTARESFDERGDPTRLLRYACNIPIIGGIAQTIYGIEELRHAQTHEAKVNGQVDLSLGLSGSINNLASLPLYAQTITRVSQHVLHICGPIAGLAACVTASIDGGRDIYNAMHGGQPSDKAVGMVKIGSGLVSAVGASMVCLPLIGASMVCLPLMGVATAVYMGAVGYQNRKSIEAAYHEAKDKVVDWIHHVEQGLGSIGRT